MRVVTINFWGIEAPLSERLALAERQLRELDPDVVAMQEVRPMNGIGGHTTADHLADALRMERVYEAALRWDSGDRSDVEDQGEEGLAILSKAPIDEHRVMALPEARVDEARILLSARTGETWTHTTHLHYRLDDGLARERQVVAICNAIDAIGGDGVHILCGDFNAPPDSDEIRYLRGLTTLDGQRVHYQDAWLRAHPEEPGHTWSAENEHTRPLRSLDINRRIDYIFVSTRQKDGRGSIDGAEVVLDERNREGVAASDHYGVLADVRTQADAS